MLLYAETKSFSNGTNATISTLKSGISILLFVVCNTSLPHIPSSDEPSITSTVGKEDGQGLTLGLVDGSKVGEYV